MAKWSVAVVGPGGVGGLLGAVLTRAGDSVVYVAKPDTAVALNAGGISLSSTQFGEFEVPAAAVTKLSGPVDLCVIAVKATSLDEALAAVPDVGDGLVLPLLNGIDHMAVLRKHFPPGQVVAGAIRVESTRLAPGRIAHTSPFCAIDLASDTAPPERVEALAGQLGAAGFDVAVRDSETTLLWDKLAILAPLALLTTHTGGPAGEVREKRRDDLEAVIREIGAVARAAGGAVEVDTVLGMVDVVPAGMKSSMQRDAEAGRPIELDAIGGAVLRAAARYGIDTPVTARIVADLRPAP